MTTTTDRPTRISFDRAVCEVTNHPPTGLAGPPTYDPEAVQGTLRYGAPLLHQVLDDLAAAGVTVPATALRARELDGDVADALQAPVSLPAWLDEQDLAAVTGADVAARIAEHATHAAVERGHASLQVAAYLLDRAAGALFDEFDRITRDLGKAWKPAAKVVADAAAAGMHDRTTAEEVLDREDWVPLWRPLGGAVETLDRVDDLVHRVMLVAGVPLAEGEKARHGRGEWLLASSGGPVELPTLTSRPRFSAHDLQGRSERNRSGTAVQQHGAIIAAGTAAERAARPVLPPRPVPAAAPPNPDRPVGAGDGYAEVPA